MDTQPSSRHPLLTLFLEHQLVGRRRELLGGEAIVLFPGASALENPGEVGLDIEVQSACGGDNPEEDGPAMAALGDWNVVPDKLEVSIRGVGLSIDAVTKFLPTLADPTWWVDARTELHERLPGYRVSKFQHLLPVEAQREIVAEMLLDVEGTRGWVARSLGVSPVQPTGA